MPAVTVRYFAAAREAAGTGRETLAGDTVGAVLDAAVALHGGALASIIGASRIWLDGEPAQPQAPLSGGEEVAVLPPVSGGSGR